MRVIVAIILLHLTLSGAAFAGKVDLDLFVMPTKVTRPAETIQYPAERYVPGNPRDLKGASLGVRRLSAAGYTGLGIAGLVGSIATGGIAPAVGFGIVTLVQSWNLWNSFSKKTG